MAKEKEIKTNAMRILDRQKIKYEVLQYECDEFIDGLHTAEKTGAPVAQSFKTLVAQGKSKQYYVLVLPIAEEVDLKKAAKAVGEKSIEMIHVKDINQVTGYIRGGCTAIGMKKQYVTRIDESAQKLEKMIVSGGRLGVQIELKVQKWNFGIFNTLYAGKDLMPYYMADPSLDYGPGLYWGEPWYRTRHNIYDRLEIYWQPVHTEIMKLRVASVHHYDGRKWGWQQKVLFSVNLGQRRLFKQKQ